MRNCPILIALLTPLVTVGCNPSPKLAPVSGKVTLNGKPVGNVRVEFHPDPDAKGTGPSSTATTDSSGQFTLASTGSGGEPGAVIGSHRVILSDLDVYGSVFVGRGNYRHEDEKGVPKEVPKIPRIPSVYSDLSKTPFKIDVVPGMEPVKLEVKK